MSFLATVSMDPHLHLHLLDKAPSHSQSLNQRIYYLAKTRRFDELLQAAAQLPSRAFPNLQQQVEAARAKSAEQKKELNEDNIEEVIAKLDEESQNDEADSKKLDEGQLRVYKLARIYFDEGDFSRAYDLIKKLEKQGLNEDLYIKTTWARLYCEILLGAPQARKTIDHLRKKIDEAEEVEKEAIPSNGSEAIQIQYSHRLYARKEEFLNLAILAYFSNPCEEDFEKFVDLCTNRDYFAVVQLACPHALRYLCVSYILNKTLHKNRQYDLFMLLEIIRRKVVKYSDPLVEFLEALNIQFDFVGSAEKIPEIRRCAESDPLLAKLADSIVQNCYFLFYKVYCKVYDRVPLQKIVEFTGKSLEEAELWILGFIRSLDIDAKIDSVEGVVLASREEESLNEKYMELLPRARGFISNLQATLQ